MMHLEQHIGKPYVYASCDWLCYACQTVLSAGTEAIIDCVCRFICRVSDSVDYGKVQGASQACLGVWADRKLFAVYGIFDRGHHQRGKAIF